MTKKNKRHIRGFLLVGAILGLLFGGLAFLANPEPPAPPGVAAVELQRPLSEVLASMSEDKVKDPAFGMTSIKAQALKMRTALEEPDFHLGPFRIGMTYEEFLAATVDQMKVLAVNKGVMGVYSILPDRFEVYFPKAEDKATAFKMSYHRVLENRRQDEVTDYLTEIWGRPTEQSCGPARDEPGDLCQFTWFPVNGVRLDAKVKATQIDDAKRARIDLRVDAYDDQARERERLQKKQEEERKRNL